MLVKKIKLHNFKNFANAEFDFRDLNLVEGKNGSGKTTLAVDSILFALYGYSEQSLEDLVSKGEKECSVTIEIDNLEITREYPTNVSIKDNGVELTLVNSKEKQNYLNNIYKNIDYFRKFRLIDIKQGINILESGKTSLMKSLSSLNQDYFNNIRQRLLDKKHDREIYNKDKAVLFTHFPSTKRLEALNMKILDASEQIYETENDINKVNRDYREVTNKKASKESRRQYLKQQKDKVLEISICPTCKQPIPEDNQKRVLKEINDELLILNSDIELLLSEEAEPKDLLSHLSGLKVMIQKRKDKLSDYRIKLEARLKQKDYIWTNRDVLHVSTAIKELDTFCSQYITEWVKILEPIINNVINKINFNVEFLLNDKGNLDMKLTKDKFEYSYKDLSSGQRLMLSLAFQIALLLEKNETGLIVADEGFSSLDEDNLKEVLGLFKNIPFQLICIVHRLYNTPTNIKIISL